MAGSHVSFKKGATKMRQLGIAIVLICSWIFSPIASYADGFSIITTLSISSKVKNPIYLQAKGAKPGIQFRSLPTDGRRVRDQDGQIRSAEEMTNILEREGFIFDRIDTHGGVEVKVFKKEISLAKIQYEAKFHANSRIRFRNGAGMSVKAIQLKIQKMGIEIKDQWFPPGLSSGEQQQALTESRRNFEENVDRWVTKVNGTPYLLDADDEAKIAQASQEKISFDKVISLGPERQFDIVVTITVFQEQRAVGDSFN